MTTGERIKKLRTSQKISQDQLAKALGISASTVGMYEQDRRKPGFEKLEAIADYFNVSLDYIMCNDHALKPNVTDDDIKFALFGDKENITDEMFDEVKQIAEYVKVKYRSKEDE